MSLKNNITTLFVEFLQIAIGKRESLSETPNSELWMQLFTMAQEQAVLGVCIEALEKLSVCNQSPPKNILLEWIGTSEVIKKQNTTINQRCVEISNIFTEAGFEICILKGQGNAMLYPEPLLRMSGDIDVWVNGSKKDIVDFVLSRYPHVNTQSSTQHVDFPVFQDVEVEVHYEPTYSLVGRYQKRLDQFINEKRNAQFSNKIKSRLFDNYEICLPTTDFNIIHQLSHMMRHFFYGGIGFRHIIDFYYLLLRCDRINRNDIRAVLSNLGMLRFAGAIMWIERNVLMLDEKYLLVDQDKKRGELVLSEIIKTGNFGHYEKRNFKNLKHYSTTLSVIAHNARLIWLFPEEALSAPITGVKRRFFKNYE